MTSFTYFATHAGAFGRVHEGRQTPWVAIALTAGLALVLVTLGDLESLADTAVLLLLIVFVCVNVAVLVLRSDRVEHEHEHFRAPGVIALLGAAACGALIVQKAFDETDTFLYAGGLIALGIVLWLINRAATSRTSRPS